MTDLMEQAEPKSISRLTTDSNTENNLAIIRFFDKPLNRRTTEMMNNIKCYATLCKDRFKIADHSIRICFKHLFLYFRYAIRELLAVELNSYLRLFCLNLT